MGLIKMRALIGPGQTFQMVLCPGMSDEVTGVSHFVALHMPNKNY